MTTTASTTQTRTVKTSDIKVGDVVREHGMRIRIDAIKTYDDRDSKVYACHGTVINLAEVLAAEIVPASFLRTRKSEGYAEDRDNFWNVQGNDLASWLVEVPLLDGLSKVELSRLVTILSKAQVDMERSGLAASGAYSEISDVKGGACTAWKSAPEGACYDSDEFALRMFVAGYFEEI